MTQITKPTAKTEGIVTQILEDETLVYDLSSNKAHCLNSTAGAVWNLCNGERTIDQIVNDFESANDSSITVEVVELALDQLNGNNLLLASETEETSAGLNRRELIKRAGMAASIAIPIVASIAVPANVMASSSRSGPGSPCASPGDCASGACLGGPPGTCL